MADTLYSVTSGFYDAVDNDRLYTADQMNMPYKRVISEGIFATPQGTASTDFQVTAAGGLDVTVDAGNALLGGKWIESGSAVQVTMTANSAILPRIDSIILRVDNNTSARAASIVYRTGTAATSPVAPDLDTSTNVYELRLADITLAAGVSVVTQNVIADMRGSADCPWITSLIQQVDTSTLFNQWEAEYMRIAESAQMAWDSFMEQLTSELTVTPSVEVETGSYTATTSVSGFTVVQLGISNFDPDKDVLLLYINGIYAEKDSRWTLTSYSSGSATGYMVSLTHNISAGTIVYAVVLRSVVAVASVTVLDDEVTKLQDKIPDAPTANGTYTLKCVSSNGTRTYQWVAD